MKIILKQDVLGLGYKDEILTVKDGYGRNYLLPKGYAILATPSAEKMLAEALAAQGLEVNPKQIAFKAVKELGHYTAIVNFHREVSVEVPFMVVNEEGEVTPKKEKPAPVEEVPVETAQDNLEEEIAEAFEPDDETEIPAEA